MSKKRMFRDMVEGYLFVLPALIIFAIFMIYPLISGFITSLTQWDGLGEKTYIGFSNYVNLLHDAFFWQSLSHNVVYALGTVPAKLILALFTAILLAGKFRGVTVYRTAFFLPMVMSYVAVALLWSYVLNGNFGLINSVLSSLGVPMNKLPIWLGKSSTALYSVMAVDVWRWFGYHTVLYIAAIQGIPNELYEAATVDGASIIQKHWYVTLPQLKTATILNGTLCFTGAFSVFELVYVMTEGGPNRATETILTYMYKQTFVGYRFGYASAICYILFLLIIVFTMFQLHEMNKE